MTATVYRRWLHANAVRFVAAPDAAPDYSAIAEEELISRGPAYLHLGRVRFSPYWALARGPGCAAAAGAYTRVTLARAGAVALVMAFSVSRIAAASPRCRQ